MPIIVFGNSSSSHDNGNKIDKSSFVQQYYLTTNYIENNLEEDIDLQVQLRFKTYQILLVLEKQLRKTVLIIFFSILV